MEFFKDDYILGFWVGGSEKFKSDFLMTVLKRKDEWLVEYRFRYHVDEKVFGSEDKKSFYGFKFKGEEEKLMVGLNQLLEYIKIKYDIEFYEVRGGFDEFRYKAALCPEMNFKMVDKEEYAKIYGKEATDEKHN